MAVPPRSRRLPRGCLVLLIAAALVAVTCGVLGTVALSTPNLGDPPGGTDHGESEQAIAAGIAAELAGQLLVRAHGVVELSEHDLTVLIHENNPNPTRYRDPQARVRDGLVVVDAHTPVGPFTVDAVARIALSLTSGGDGLPQVSADFRSVQVGGLGLPDFAARALQDRIQHVFDLQNLLSSDNVLRLARGALDCVAVAGDAVRLGFHRPGVAQAPQDCG